METEMTSDPMSTKHDPGPVQHSSQLLRHLTADELSKLENDRNLVSHFKQSKLEQEAQRNWDLFYKRNTTKFFKDRQWTTREFEELTASTTTVLLEVGCGVGNFIFPLLEHNENLYIHACDFSPRAVQFVKDHPSYNADRCSAFQCDLTRDSLTDHVAAKSVDVVTMIFVLSAIHPDKMAQVLANIKTVMKSDGVVLLRDYGLYDHAMLRFTPGHKLAPNFYVRQDGTRAFYFTLEYLEQLFIDNGFVAKKCEYIYRSTINKKEGIDVPRVFVQASFHPSSTADNVEAITEIGTKVQTETCLALTESTQEQINEVGNS